MSCFFVFLRSNIAIISLAATGEDVWFGLSNFDDVSCDSPAECHDLIMWLDGTRYDQTSTLSINPVIDINSDKKCTKFDEANGDPKISHTTCSLSAKLFICQYQCDNPTSKISNNENMKHFSYSFMYILRSIEYVIHQT